MQETDNAPIVLSPSPGGGQVATMESFAMSPDAIIARKRTLALVMEKVMKDGTHFGKIPGCGDKPTLLKPGAEAISSTFQLCPKYDINKVELGNGHREYELVCSLYTPDGSFVGQGVGSCSTMEGKYRFRKAGHKCPECGKEETIIKGKQQYGGGWVCYNKKGGCGAKFPDGDERIENQNIGKVEHDNPADYYNTVLKMGKKRAFVDAVLTATGASDIFTQDIEDMPETIPGARQNQNRQQPQGGQGYANNQSTAMSQMDDIPDYAPTNSGEPQHVPLTDQQKRKIFGACKGKNIELDALCLSLTDSNSFNRKIMRVTDLSKQEASTLIGWLDTGELDFLAKAAA
jgi:ssDNA-binding Zn-finger/Zn-ribbon topoisomerase 1